MVLISLLPSSGIARHRHTRVHAQDNLMTLCARVTELLTMSSTPFGVVSVAPESFSLNKTYCS